MVEGNRRIGFSRYDGILHSVVFSAYLSLLHALLARAFH